LQEYRGSSQSSSLGRCNDVTKMKFAAPQGNPLLVNRWKRSLMDPANKRQLMQLLEKTSLFSGCRADFRSSICDIVWPVTYVNFQVVYCHGDPGDWMGIIISGKFSRMLQRRNSDISIGDIGPGALFGDIGLMGLDPTRTFTVTALTDATVLVLTREGFETCVKCHGGPKSTLVCEDAQNMMGLMEEKADKAAFIDLKCFEGLDRDFVSALHDTSEPRLCYPSQIVMREKAYGNEMYVLRAGQVKVEKDGKTIAELGSRDDCSQGIVLGELAVLASDKRRMATVVCTSLCFFRVLHGDDFHRILAEHPSAKRVFDHRYIARIVPIYLRTVHDERKKYDNFYGSATPRTAAEMHKLFAAPKVAVGSVSAPLAIEAKHPKASTSGEAAATKASKKHAPILPPINIAWDYNVFKEALMKCHLCQAFLDKTKATLKQVR